MTRRGTREIPVPIRIYHRVSFARNALFAEYVKCVEDRKSCSRTDNWFTIDRHQYIPDIDSDFALCTARRMVSIIANRIERSFHDDSKVLCNFILIKWSSRGGWTRWNSWLCSRQVPFSLWTSYNSPWNLYEIFRAQDRLIIALRFGQRLSKFKRVARKSDWHRHGNESWY